MMDFAKIITLFVCSFLQATFGFPNSGHLASGKQPAHLEKVMRLHVCFDLSMV